MTTQLYGRIKKVSKYIHQQPQNNGNPVLFSVEMRASFDGYIWQGNENQYRSSDLSLYVIHPLTGKPVKLS